MVVLHLLLKALCRLMGLLHQGGLRALKGDLLLLLLRLLLEVLDARRERFDGEVGRERRFMLLLQVILRLVGT